MEDTSAAGCPERRVTIERAEAADSGGVSRVTVTATATATGMYDEGLGSMGLPPEGGRGVRALPPATSKTATSPRQAYSMRESGELPSPATLTTELAYYRGALSEAIEHVKKKASWPHEDIQLASRWRCRLLDNAYYTTSRLRDKRNRYLLRLLLCLLGGELHGLFKSPPMAESPLPKLPGTPPHGLAPAAWEEDATWDAALDALPCETARLPCSVHHGRRACPQVDQAITKQMDEEFRFFLYMARPYAALLPRSSSRTAAALWLQLLCAVREDSCPVMKGVRNDYMQVLLGYLYWQRLDGPFSKPPIWGTLPPLQVAAANTPRGFGVTDPCGIEADDFLSMQPVPKSGAFCYVAVSGDVLRGCGSSGPSSRASSTNVS